MGDNNLSRLLGGGGGSWNSFRRIIGGLEFNPLRYHTTSQMDARLSPRVFILATVVSSYSRGNPAVMLPVMRVVCCLSSCLQMVFPLTKAWEFWKVVFRVLVAPLVKVRAEIALMILKHIYQALCRFVTGEGEGGVVCCVSVSICPAFRLYAFFLWYKNLLLTRR